MEGYIIGILITLAIVIPLVLVWVHLLDKNRDDYCPNCDPDTCPFPPCYDCPKIQKKDNKQ